MPMTALRKMLTHAAATFAAVAMSPIASAQTAPQPRNIIFVLVDDLPRVPSGKVKKDILRIRAREIAEG